MATLTEEQIKKVDDIPTSEVEQDILDTQKEVDQLKKELDALSGNPVDNKVQIYFREGKISQRLAFISTLEQILAYRKKNNL